MKRLDESDLDTALALGDAICGDLGVCCEQKGRVIHKILGKLEELRAQAVTTGAESRAEPPK